MKRLKTYLPKFSSLIIIIIVLSISSCATSRKSKLETQRQGFLLLNKSEFSMNKGKFKDTKTPRELKKTRRKMRKGRR